EGKCKKRGEVDGGLWQLGIELGLTTKCAAFARGMVRPVRAFRHEGHAWFSWLAAGWCLGKLRLARKTRLSCAFRLTSSQSRTRWVGRSRLTCPGPRGGALTSNCR